MRQRRDSAESVNVVTPAGRSGRFTLDATAVRASFRRARDSGVARDDTVCLFTAPGRHVDQRFKLKTETINLDALLKVVAVADSGGRAKHLIQQGSVSVNGTVVTQRGKKIRRGDVVTVASEPPARIIVEGAPPGADPAPTGT